MRGLFAAALLACVAFATVELDEGVHVLTNDNFDGFLAENDFTLIEFYAPWCGHCKKLAPEYSQAADALKDEVSLAKVDCTAETDVCQKFEVRGYPTIKLFNKGSPSPYEGPRTADGIVQYLRSRMLPAVSDIDSTEAAEELKGKAALSVFAFYETSDEASAKAFADAADLLRDDATFAAVTDAAVAKEMGVESFPALKLFRSFDEPQVDFEDEFNTDLIEAFVIEKSFALVGEIGPENYKKYMDRGLPLMWMAVDPDSESDMAIIEFAKNVAKDFTSDLSMVYLDGVKFAAHIKNLGLGGSLPGIIITDQPSKFIHPEDEEITEDSLRTFVSAFKEGNLQAFLKSEEPPADNDGPVTVIVGKTFDEIVMNSEQDVLVEYYAPWCGHCKKLAPIYDELGEEFANDEGVIIAKIDATENDTPIDVSGFPTLVFFPAGDKENNVRFSGDRTQEAMSAFIKENGQFAGAVKEEL